ncbi:MAG TPA: NPCBM/NEW2 domain-containing protein [Pirellulales bacterium]|jgi:hypothetical protein|nr:NPCBM/NEW2 domain-containing protein [Pirellulales bacterium]
MLRILLPLIVLLCGANPLVAAGKLVPIDGQPLDATLVGVDADWQMRFAKVDAQETEDPIRLSAAKIVSWGALHAAPLRPQLVLSGGGLLVADVLKLDKERLPVDSALLGPIALPLESVLGVIFQPPALPAQHDMLVRQLIARKDAAGRTLDADRLILANGDQLQGTIVALDERSVQLERGSRAAPVEVARLAALAFNPSLVNDPADSKLHALVGLRDGSRLSIGRMEIAGQEAVLHPSADLALAWKIQADAVVFVQPLRGEAVYLSDLPVAGYRHVPFLSTSWPYELDRSAEGAQLRAGGQIYPKGIGMHSASRLTWTLDRPYARFAAEVAIDDAGAERGSVTFRVYVDREQKLATPIVRSGQQPVPISVDLRGAKQLSLVVDFAERGDQQDYADWLNARLVP